MRKHFLPYINNSTTNKMSKIFLIVVHIVIHNGGGNNGDIPRSLKYYIQNFKTSLKRYTAFNEFVIKNTLDKR